MLPARRRRTKRKSNEPATGSEEQEEVAQEDEEEMGDKPQVSIQLYSDDRCVTLHFVAKVFSR